MSTDTIKRILSIKEAAAYIGVCERTFYNYSVQYGGTIPIIKMSKRRNCVDVVDLEKFIASRKEVQ